METTPFSNVGDLSGDQRHAVESMIGRALAPQDVVFLVVLRPDRVPTTEEKSRAWACLEKVFERVDRHGQDQGISVAEADAAIDSAVRDVRSRAS